VDRAGNTREDDVGRHRRPHGPRGCSRGPQRGDRKRDRVWQRQCEPSYV